MILFFSFLFLMSATSSAHTDFSYGADLRSYPFGTNMKAELGYNQMLWGSTSSPMYGMIRPSAQLNTSVVVSNLVTKVTLYPISFIGLGVGSDKVNSTYEEFTYFDCDDVRCKGTMDKNFQFGKIALGYGSLLSTFHYQESKNAYSHDDDDLLPVGEYSYILEVDPAEEKEVHKSYFLGYKAGEKIYGLVSQNVEFLESDKSFHMHLGIFRHKISHFNLTYGVGNLYSSDQDPGAVIIFKVGHVVWPSLALF